MPTTLLRKMIKVLLFSILLFLSILLLYVSVGYKALPITQYFENSVIANLQKKYNVQLSYTNMNEIWDGYTPYIILSELEIKDINQNNYHISNLKIKINLVESLLENKIVVDNLDISNILINYVARKRAVNSVELYSSFYKNIENISISINSFNVNYNEIGGKKYTIRNGMFNYEKNNPYFVFNYNNLNIKQFFITKENPIIKTVAIGNTSNIVSTLETLGFDRIVEKLKYNYAYTIEGDVNIIIESQLKLDKIEVLEANITLQNNTINLLSSNTKIENINGIIKYDNNKTISSNMFSCQLYQQSCQFKISSNDSGINIDFESYINKEIIYKYVPLLKDSTIEGISKIKGNYNISLNGNHKMYITSDFKGISIKDIPSFNKDINSQKLITLNYYKTTNQSYLELYYGTNTIFINLKELNDIQIYLDKKETYQEKKGFYVYGSIQDINLNELLNILKKIKKVNDKVMNHFIDVEFKNLNYFNISLESVRVFSNLDNISVTVNDPNIKGDLIYSLSSNSMDLTMEKFYYKSLNLKNDITKNLKLENFPTIKAVIHNININGYKGDLSFMGENKNNMYTLYNLEGMINEIKPLFDIVVSSINNELKTELKSLNDNKLIEFSDLNSLILDNNNLITSSQGVLYGELAWLGIIPNITSLKGRLKFELNNGKVNIGKMGSIAFNQLPIANNKYISKVMNFTKINTEVNYSKLTGSGYFDKGFFTIDDAVIIKSNYLDVLIKGDIDIINSKYDKLDIEIKIPLK